VFLLSAGAAFGALAMLLGRWSDRLDALNHFAPYILGLDLIILAVALLFGGRPKAPAVAAALVAVASAGFLVLPEMAATLTQPQAKSHGPVLKVVQFNVWHGNVDPAGTLAWIVRENPDIVLIQEDAGRAIPLVAGLNHAFPYGPNCQYPRPCDAGVFSRHPVSATGRWPQQPLTWAVVRWQGRDVPVISTHHSWAFPAGEQQWQSRRLVKYARSFPARNLIVAGDMNSTPWSFSLRRQDETLGLERRTRGLFTWPARLLWPFDVRVPLFPIDHVYAGGGWETVSVRRGPRLGSDHYPVVVELAPR
jgi:endonuclease/exonuclease/phosphatase (EEP) superfamily protein YafD